MKQDTREQYTFNGITVIVHERKNGQVYYHRKKEGDPDDWEHCSLERKPEKDFDADVKEWGERIPEPDPSPA